MTRSYRGIEWLDRASDSRYPLVPMATARDTQDIFEIPNDLLVSVYLAIPADLLVSPGYVFISRVVHTSSVLILYISAEIDGDIELLGQFEVSVEAMRTAAERSGYGLTSFVPVTAYADVRGRLTIHDVNSLKNQPQGDFTFDFEGAGLDPDSIRPNIRHVSSIEVEQNGSTLQLRGPVQLAAGDNVRFRVEVEDSEPVLYLDALDTTQLNEDLECDIGESPFVRRVNGIPGDSQRNVSIVGSRCLEVETGAAELHLRNRCSEPCASCDEAEAVRSLILPYQQQIPTLIGLLNRLDAAVTQTTNAVALSTGGQGECAGGGG